jgi:LysM repeat protein
LPADTEVWLPRGTRIDRSEIDAQLRVAEPHARTKLAADELPESGTRTTFYRVRAGDTLGAIASRQGVSLSALRRLNDMRTEGTSFAWVSG